MNWKNDNNLRAQIEMDVLVKKITEAAGATQELASDIQPIPLETTLPPTLSILSRRSKKVLSETLLSEHRPCISDVLGNLGPPSVVTDQSVGDWLKDRWQSAMNMRGEPIPGEHFLEIDLQRPCTITKIVLDWEDAYCAHYMLIGHNGMTGVTKDLKRLALSADARVSKPSKQHVVHELIIPPPPPQHARKTPRSYRFVRLVMHNPSTQWGSSVWRFNVYGWENEG